MQPDAARRSTFLIALMAALWLAMLLLGGPLSPADRTLLPLFRAPTVVPEALAVTRLGNAYFLLPLSLAALIVIALRCGRRPALLYLVLVLSGRVLVEAQKDLIGRMRPDPSGRLDTVTSFSFPSAHAANSMVAWLGFALIVTPPRYRIPAVAAALAVAMIVGLTRLLLAVHWPSDVIGGWAFGTAWTLLVLRLVPGTSPPLRH
jgi:undecaprenyl-diphosphatase